MILMPLKHCRRKCPGLFLFLGLTLFSACTTSKTVLTASEEEFLREIVHEKGFVVKAAWAIPRNTAALNQLRGLLPPDSNPNMINLSGTANTLTFAKDSVFARLPYFGERQVAGAYSPNTTGIQFEGRPNKLEVGPNTRNGAYQVDFEINNSTENFQVTLWLYPNKTVHCTILSNQRFSIGYRGSFLPMDGTIPK